MSETGVEITAATTALGIYTSTDMGITFTGNALEQPWLSITTSGDGTFKYAVTDANESLWKLQRFIVSIDAETADLSMSGTLRSEDLWVNSSKIHLGTGTATNNQGPNAVAIGKSAGVTNQGFGSVAVGDSAGNSEQKIRATAVGGEAGNVNQGDFAVAVGSRAGFTNQETNAVSVGTEAGSISQGESAVACGTEAGSTSQAAFSVAIGPKAGSVESGVNGVYIGYRAGQIGDDHANVIILNSSGVNVSPTEANQLIIAAGSTRLEKDSTTLNVHNTKISNVTDPTDLQDAATKNYVDTVNNVFPNGVPYLTERVFFNNDLRTMFGSATAAYGGFLWKGPLEPGGEITTDRNWISLDGSDDFTEMVAVVFGGDIWRSNNIGETWVTESGTPRDWVSVASDATGTYRFAVVSGGHVWRSISFGTWTEITSGSQTLLWSGIAVNSTGTLAAACVAGGQIYISTDIGSNWVLSPTSPIQNWTAISVGGGKIIATASPSTDIYVSSDSGTSWSFQYSGATPLLWTNVKISSDGLTGLAVEKNGGIYTFSPVTGTVFSQLPTVGVTFTGAALTPLSSTFRFSICGSEGTIFRSPDDGLTWVDKSYEMPGIQSWNSSAVSETGQYQTAVKMNGRIWSSADYGVTWEEDTSVPTVKSWFSIAMSADGQDRTALADSAYPPTNLASEMWRSIDYGINWAVVNVYQNPVLRSIAISGTTQIAGAIGGKLYVSINSGVVFAEKNVPTSTWIGVAVASGNASFQCAVSANGLIVNSTDEGDNWTTAFNDSTVYFYSVAMSADGVYRTAASETYLYVSSDSGVTWVARGSEPNSYSSVSMSANGQYQFAAVFEPAVGEVGSAIWRSTDYGITWDKVYTKEAPLGFQKWTSIEISNDASYLVATDQIGNVWTGDGRNKEIAGIVVAQNIVLKDVEPYRILSTNAMGVVVETGTSVDELSAVEGGIVDIAGIQTITGAKTFQANVSLGGNAVTNVSDPVDPQDASTKSYVDTEVSVNTGTGVLTGGTLSLVGAPGTSALYNISDGSGYIADPSTGTVDRITWSNLTNQAATYTGNVTFVSLNATGVPVYRPIPLTPQEEREEIRLGVLVHTVDPLLLDNVNNEPAVITYPTNQIVDLMNALGFLNLSGNIVSATIPGLTIQKSEGEILASGANFANNPRNPHRLTLLAINTSTGGTFQYIYRDGSSSALNLTALIPAEYDSGDGQGDPGILTTNSWQIQRVFLFVSNNLAIQPGQQHYPSQADAQASLTSEPFVTEESIVQNGLLIGYIIVRGAASDLSISTDAVFVAAGKFGGDAQNTASGGTTSLQRAYDNSTANPEIVTSGTGGALTLKTGTAADTDLVMEIQNGASTTTFSVDGNGLAECADLKIENSTISLGLNAGVGQGTQAVAVGSDAGNTTQGANSVAVGCRAGVTVLAPEAVAVGHEAGATNSTESSVYIGRQAGNDGGDFTQCVVLSADSNLSRNPTANNQIKICAGSSEIQVDALGLTTASTLQSTSATTGSIHTAGGVGVAKDIVCDGSGQFANITTTAGNVALGTTAGATSQGASSIAIGIAAGNSSQGQDSVAIGRNAGSTSQLTNSVAIGGAAGKLNQGANSIAIGRQSGETAQQESCVAIGGYAGQGSQGQDSVAIGRNAGSTSQLTNCVAIGAAAGKLNQGISSIAIGRQSGETAQQENCVAIGGYAGQVSQGGNSIAVGISAGRNSLAPLAVAIGREAGEEKSTDSSIYIGRKAGEDGGSFTGAVVISSKGSAVNPSAHNQLKIEAGTTTLTSDATGLRTNNSLDSTSITTGAMTTAGGMGIAKNLYVGGEIHTESGKFGHYEETAVTAAPRTIDFAVEILNFIGTSDQTWNLPGLSGKNGRILELMNTSLTSGVELTIKPLVNEKINGSAANVTLLVGQSLRLIGTSNTWIASQNIV
jgi:hypothetical protein